MNAENNQFQDIRSNTRVFIRSMFPKEPWVQFQYGQGLPFLEGELHSISSGGCYVKSKNIPKVDTPLEIHFPFGDRKIQCLGKVIYNDTGEKELNVRGFGIRFTRMVNGDYYFIKNSIADFLNSIHV